MTAGHQPQVQPARIGFYAVCHTSRRTGINVFVEDLVGELARRWKLIVYTAEPAGLERPNVEIRRVPGWVAERQVMRLLWNSMFMGQLVRRDRLDLLISPLPELPPGLRIPTIAVVHDLTPLVVAGSSTRLYRQLFEFALRRLDSTTTLVAISRHTQADLQRLGLARGQPARVIPQASESRAARPHQTASTATPAGRPSVLYVGGWSAYKNVPRLIAAFATIAREFPHELILVGGGKPRARRQIVREIAKSGLSARIRMLSEIPEDALDRLYSNCEVFVYPSLYEGFGLPVLEAMARGVPVLSSNATSLPEVGGDAVTYFSPESVDELAAGLRRLLGDEGLRRQLGEKGKERSRQFTHERRGDAYHELIADLLSARHQGFPVRGTGAAPTPSRRTRGRP